MPKGRAAAATAIAAVGLGLASAAYQTVGEARDRRRHPPPGRLVDVGGYRLHIVCEGEGAPPVIICPALGATTDEWERVQHLAARTTTVCVYDRAGLGYSEPPRRPRTGRRMAEELHALLRAAGLQPPYVLAGHSMGGFVVRIFAALYPDEIGGFILVDSSHPEQASRLPRHSVRDYPGGMFLAASYRWVRPLGMRRLARCLRLTNGESVQGRYNRRAISAELITFKAIGRETTEVTGSLGELPLTVLSANGEHAHPGYSREWVVLQEELAALSTCSTHIEADHGGHHLNHDNPELVAEVITDLVGRVRAGGTEGKA